MKATELIKKLQEIIDEYGDVEVIMDTEYRLESIVSVDAEELPDGRNRIIIN